jgi:hypothetical protein
MVQFLGSRRRAWGGLILPKQATRKLLELPGAVRSLQRQALADFMRETGIFPSESMVCAEATRLVNTGEGEHAADLNYTSISASRERGLREEASV